MISLICPDSPKWLLLQGRTKEAIDALNYIAWFNRSPNRISPDTMFIEAAIAGNLENNESYNADQSVSRAISQLTLRATQMLETRRDAQTGPKKRTTRCTLLFFLIMMPILSTQYYSMYFLAATVGTNKFINCCLIGSGEIIGATLTAFLLSRMHDHYVFISAAVLACVANFAYYFVPEGGAQFACFLLFVVGLSGQFNSIYVVIELRIPPENVGAAIVIVTTVGTLVSSIAPYIVNFGFPSTLIIPSCLAAMNAAMMTYVGAPESFLPKAVKLSKNVTILKLETVNQVINDTIQNSMYGYSMNYSITYFEKINNVERPRLNETNLDPGLLGDGD